MNKDKILEKARKESIDEGYDNAINKGYSAGLKISGVVFFILLILKYKNNITYTDIAALEFGFCAGIWFNEYKFLKTKYALFNFIMCTLATIGCLYLYITKYILG